MRVREGHTGSLRKSDLREGHGVLAVGVGDRWWSPAYHLLWNTEQSTDSEDTWEEELVVSGDRIY